VGWRCFPMGGSLFFLFLFGYNFKSLKETLGSVSVKVAPSFLELTAVAEGCVQTPPLWFSLATFFVCVVSAFCLLPPEGRSLLPVAALPCASFPEGPVPSAQCQKSSVRSPVSEVQCQNSSVRSLYTLAPPQASGI